MENRKHHETRGEEPQELNRLFGSEVMDRDKESIGTIENIWLDHTGQPAFFGVQTGWLFGKINVVPAHHAEVNYGRRRVRLPHSQEKVKDAPSFEPSEDLSPEQENEVYRYYGLPSGETQTHTASREKAETEEKPPRHTEADPSSHSEDERNIQLNEERVDVRKEQKDIGGVRLKKIIRTETVNKPVELTHEDIEVERVPAKEGQKTAPGNLEEDEIYIPLRKEEAVTHKETHPKEQIRVTKKTERERKDVSETVRREDLEVKREEDKKKKYGT